jgi:ubiquinone/menaquinone biosynthesis C-methylase UbiE
MDVTRPLDFPDHSFDLINSRFIGTFMPTKTWPELFRECRRILRPGGILRMTEFERGLTNSPAHERMSTLFTQSQHGLGMGFSPDGNHMGILPMLGWFFQQAGFEQIQSHYFAVDYSFGSEDHQEWYQDLRVLFKLAQKFMIQTGVATQEELDRLYERAIIEMDLPEFRAILPCISVWGRSPDASHPQEEKGEKTV